jgi:superoxide dismutase, Fe-Mn family
MNTYVTNLDAALEKHPEADPANVQELLASIESVPVDIRTAMSGGRYHHRGSLYLSLQIIHDPDE